MDAIKVQLVQQSFGRCLLNKLDGKAFLDAFYDDFIASDPRIKPLFAKTNMAKQKSLLRDGLVKLMMYAGGSDVAKRSITKLALRHDQNNLNIDPALYRIWLKSLLACAKKYDQKFDAAASAAWTEALELGIKVMKDAYRQSP